MFDLIGRYTFHVMVLAIVGGLYFYADMVRRSGVTASELLRPLPGLSSAMDREAPRSEYDPADLAAQLSQVPLSGSAREPASSPLTSVKE